MRRGRPIRFLTVLLAGWLAARTMMLWPDDARLPKPADDFVPYALARHDQPLPAQPRQDSFLPYPLSAGLTSPRAPVRPTRGGSAPPMRPALAVRPMSDARILALFGLRYYIEVPAAAPVGPPPPPAAPVPLPAAMSAPVSLAGIASPRWRTSGWLTWRPGGGDPRLVPLLGGSQAGARVSYAFDPERRMAAYARASAPLGRGGGELAAGVEWRAGEVPIAAYAEVRGREQGGAAAAAGVYGGALRDIGGFRLDGYGQAGIVAGRASTGFAEAQVRATRRIGPRLDAGAGIWGAAQQGAARLDIGPTLGLGLPVGRGGARLTLDWRQRVAGNARPDSGIALSLGTDF